MIGPTVGDVAVLAVIVAAAVGPTLVRLARHGLEEVTRWFTSSR